jgi:hypothetical protein
MTLPFILLGFAIGAGAGWGVWRRFDVDEQDIAALSVATLMIFGMLVAAQQYGAPETVVAGVGCLAAVGSSAGLLLTGGRLGALARPAGGEAA